MPLVDATSAPVFPLYDTAMTDEWTENKREKANIELHSRDNRNVQTMSSVWERERVAKMKEREKRDLKSRSDCLFFLRRPTSRSDYIRLWNSITPMKIHISYSLDNSSVFFELCLFFFCLSSSTRSNSLSFFFIFYSIFRKLGFLLFRSLFSFRQCKLMKLAKWIPKKICTR